MTKRELIQKSVEIANRGLDPNASPIIDAESLAEPLLESVFTSLAEEYAAKGKFRPLPRKTKTVTFSNGTATLDTDVLLSCLEDSTLTDPDDSSKMYSYVPNWHDFINAPDNRIGLYTSTTAGTMVVTEPDEAYVSGSGLGDDRILTTICVWAIPAGLDTDLALPKQVEAHLQVKLGEALRGAMAPK